MRVNIRIYMYRCQASDTAGQSVQFRGSDVGQEGNGNNNGRLVARDWRHLRKMAL